MCVTVWLYDYVCLSSLQKWSLFLLVGFTDPYNYTYSESLWWKIFKNHKRTQIQRDRQRQRHRQIASFCFLLLLLHFSKRIKDFIPPKIAPFSSPIFVSSTDQKFSLVKLCLSPWTQYFSSLKLLCFYLWVLNLFFVLRSSSLLQTKNSHFPPPFTFLRQSNNIFYMTFALFCCHSRFFSEIKYFYT